MERIIRRFAGTFILISLVLAHFHSPNWLWFTAFVCSNLLQSSFTHFCPLEIVRQKNRRRGMTSRYLEKLMGRLGK